MKNIKENLMAKESSFQEVNNDLQQKIYRIYDHLYASSFTKTPNGICKEVGKVLHTGLYLEGRIPAFEFSRSEINEILRGKGGFSNTVALEICQTFQNMNSKWEFYEKNSKIEINNFDLSYTVGQLNNIVLSNREKDIFGDALEIFRCQWAKREGGQFFTDQRVTKLAMSLLEFDPRNGDDLIDICAGTGGFLLAGLNRIRDLLEKDQTVKTVESELAKYASKSLLGQEIDKDVADAANTTLAARLGKYGNCLVQNGDSLNSNTFNEKVSVIKFNKHLCAASNPPFGTKITIKNPDILKEYELATRNHATKRESNGSTIYPTPPDILLLERNVQMLKKGRGKLAIVLPYQLLSGPKTYFVRNWLLRNTQLLAVIDLPPETFQPHTGTKTSLILAKRRLKPLDNFEKIKDYDIFMSSPKWIGHDRRGNSVYKKTIEGKSTDEILTDFPEVERAWSLFRKGKNPKLIHEMSFRVKFSTIVKDSFLRINALFHKPTEEATKKSNMKLKSSGWNFVKLSDVVKSIFYPGRFKRNYVDYFPGAVPFLGGSNITEYVVRKEKWLSPTDPRLEELCVQSGWILITRSGTTGIVSSVPKAWDGYALSEHIIRIIPDPEKLNPNYLLAFLRSRYCKEQLARGVFGSVIDEITPEHIGEMRIPIPPSKKQIRKIETMVAKSENARQEGIENLTEAVEKTNELLSV